MRSYRALFRLNPIPTEGVVRKQDLDVSVSLVRRLVQLHGGRVELETSVGVGPPDLILLDLMMDAMDGFEVAAKLRENEASASVPVVVLTVKEPTASDREYLRGRINALFRKQGSQHQLVSVIEDLVARRRGG